MVSKEFSNFDIIKKPHGPLDLRSVILKITRSVLPEILLLQLTFRDVLNMTLDITLKCGLLTCSPYQSYSSLPPTIDIDTVPSYSNLIPLPVIQYLTPTSHVVPYSSTSDTVPYLLRMKQYLTPYQ